jgi:hypothetical protein
VSVLLFLNELSCADPHPKEQVSDAMRQFVQLLRHIARLRSDSVLVSDVKREELELAPGYYLAEWAGQPANLDLWRFLRRMQDRAPFSAVLPPGVGEGVEYSWNDRTAKALGAADLMGGLLVSLLVDEHWTVPVIQAVRHRLEATADGDATVAMEDVSVKHAATLDHTRIHEDWLKQVGVLDLEAGAELWEARAAFLPHLQFLPRVEEQLRELRPEWVIPAARELCRIDDAITDWDPRARPLPVWRSLITPEGEQRKRLCWFADVDGVERLFDLHGRFTPGAGRVYFRLVPEERTARVANIGLKLGI